MIYKNIICMPKRETLINHAIKYITNSKFKNAK